MWVVNKEKTIAMSVLSKCASSSIQDYMPAACNRVYFNEEILDIPVRVGWIRNPFGPEGRLVSAYSFFHFMFKNNPKFKFPNGSIETFSNWRSFVDNIFKVEDRHWMPQTELLTLDGAYLPTVTHRFEDIGDRWNDYYEGLLPWLRRCQHLDYDPDYRAAELEDYYAEDVTKWHSAAH